MIDLQLMHIVERLDRMIRVLEAIERKLPKQEAYRLSTDSLVREKANHVFIQRMVYEGGRQVPLKDSCNVITDPRLNSMVFGPDYCPYAPDEHRKG